MTALNQMLLIYKIFHHFKIFFLTTSHTSLRIILNYRSPKLHPNFFFDLEELPVLVCVMSSAIMLLVDINIHMETVHLLMTCAPYWVLSILKSMLIFQPILRVIDWILSVAVVCKMFLLLALSDVSGHKVTEFWFNYSMSRNTKL